MGRRFPTPVIGVPTDEARYRTVAGVAYEVDGAIEWTSFQEQCRDVLRKGDSDDKYSESYIRRILSTYVELGVIDRVGEHVEPSPFIEELFDGDLSFSEFLWQCLKRSWVAMGEKPEGIEALERILRVIERADTTEGLTRGEVRGRLETEYDYEFNDADIRGYPELLTMLGACTKTDDNRYQLATEEVVERYKRRFRSVDIFDTLEARLKREGSSITPPTQTAKRDLMKYYMYRESGGWSKRRQWYQTFWRDYLQPETREGNTGSELRRKQAYRDAENRKQSLRKEIKTRFDGIESQALRGLSASVLERMSDAETQREAQQLHLSAGSGISRADLKLITADRSGYTFSSEFSLYDWQQEAASAWFDSDHGRAAETGIAQVVTGAGKTVMALEVIRRWLHDSIDDDGVVTVVVPTRVLMHQWLTELVTTLNVPVEEIGWAGGGHKDDFSDCSVLVTIVNSAVQDDFLGDALDAAGQPEHLLIADECHRYTGEKFSNIFSYPRTASLGLSATPVSRGDDRTESDELLLTELGDIFYDLSYDEGIERGLIPEFTVRYVGFELADPERREYDALSRKVSDAVKDIRQQYGDRLYELPGGFAQKLQIIKKHSDGPTPAIGDYFQYTQERRELVSDAVARQAITLELLKNAVEADQKTIVFQERIDQLEKLVSPVESRGVNPRTGELSEDAPDHRQSLYENFDGLKEVDQAIENLFERPEYWPVMYHSRHSRGVWNDIAMDWFRQEDMANVMLSVKALIEGVDVPSADIGIVRVSSSSIRQRIQTLGRILRTGEDASKQSTLYVIYARDTVDERIFEEYDWKEELASAKVEHKIWDRDEAESHAEGYIRPAEPDERPPRPEPETIPNPDELEIGDPYDAWAEPVKKVSVDSRRNLFEKTQDGRNYLSTDGFEAIIDYVSRKKGGGTIIVTDHDHLVTYIEDQMVFLGTVESPDVFEQTDDDIRHGGGGLTSENGASGSSDSSGSLTDDSVDSDDVLNM